MFAFDRANLVLKKLTQKILVANEIEVLPPTLFLQFFVDEEGAQQLLLLTNNLEVATCDLKT